MKAVRITLGVLGVLLVLFIAGMFYLADYLDKHQDMLAQTASKALGREVRIEDGVTMHGSIAEASDILPRVTNTNYFRRKHYEIPARLVRGNNEVGSFSNCQA